MFVFSVCLKSYEVGINVYKKKEITKIFNISYV
jgi:hypothetical protein